MGCGGFNENGPCRVVCLNIWSLVGRTAWGRIRMGGLVEGALKKLS